MKEIKKPQINNFYIVYDKNGELKGKIEQSKEKNIGSDEWLRGVSCFVLNKNNEVLVERRAKKGLTPGKLDLCSGHIDGKENPTQAMIRELNEELGIQIEESMNVRRITEKPCPLVFESSGKNRNFLIDFYYLKRNKSDVKKQKEEVDEIYWVPMEECFELIKSGKTKFPKDFDYTKVFKEVEESCNNKEIEMSRED